MVTTFVFCTQAGKKNSTSMAMALIFYYGNLGLGAYPWEAGDHSEHTNDKDSVLEYLIMFSNMCFHLRYSVLESPTVLITPKECFWVLFCFFFWEEQCPGQWYLYKEEGGQFYYSSSLIKKYMQEEILCLLDYFS